MNLKEMKSLAEIMTANGLTCLEYEEDGRKLRLERQITVAAPAGVFAPSMPIPAAVPAAAGDGAEQSTHKPSGKEMKAPMVGMFYDSPSPEAEPYVKVGSKVKKGDVLCVIEAMKLLNEITAEADGEIIAVCAANGEIVEYGQALFEIA